MSEPIFWLGLSILLVAVSLTAVLVAALPALRELARAARSAEKLFDTLSRELPPTLEAIRLTGLEISDLTDDVSEGVQSAGRVVKQVDQSISGVKRQAKQAQVTTRSVFVGIKAAWKAFKKPSNPRRPTDRLSSSSRNAVNFEDSYEEPYGDRFAAHQNPYLEEDSDAEYIEGYSEISASEVGDSPSHLSSDLSSNIDFPSSALSESSDPTTDSSQASRRLYP